MSMNPSWQQHERWLQERQRSVAQQRKRNHWNAGVRDSLMMGPPAVVDVFRRLAGRPPRLGKLYGYEKGLARAVNHEVEASAGYGADPITVWRHKSTILRARIEANSEEWAYHYLLAFTALEVAELEDSLAAATRMQELRPADPRSPHSLGTVYAFIATVATVNDNELYNLLLNLPGSFTTDVCAQLLDTLGLTAESAAIEAHRWFKRTLDVGLHPQDRPTLDWNLATVRSWLPEELQEEE